MSTCTFKKSALKHCLALQKGISSLLFFAERDPPFECDYGLVGDVGVCVPFDGSGCEDFVAGAPTAAAPAAVSDGPCGTECAAECVGLELTGTHLLAAVVFLHRSDCMI